MFFRGKEKAPAELGGEKLKTLVLTFVLLVVAIMAGAQSTDGLNSTTDTADSRPSEAEIFLDDNPVAQEGAAPDVVELPGVGFGDFARVILVLGIVIALIYGFVWLLRKFSGVKAEGSDVIRLLSTRPLKGDTALHLVEIGSRVFLVGSNSNSVSLISEIDDQESIDEVHLNASQGPVAVSGGFARMFRDRFGSGPVASRKTAPVAAAPETDSAADPASYLRKQRERLKDL